jgi:hypothetical protein
MAENEVQSVSIKVDTATLSMSPYGSITGVIALCEANRWFPSVSWRDFPVVILAWWLEPVPQIIRRKTKIWECRFMDGPLLLELTQQKDDIWTMTGSDNDCVAFKATVSCQAFIRRLLSVGCEVLSSCRQRGWQNRDMEILASNLKTAELSEL